MAKRQLPPLNSLVFFEAVARNSSFSAAALELEVSQAAVSKRIASLEEQLGYSLFDRVSRRPSLTANGEVLFERTKAALDYLDDAFAGINSHLENPTRVGTNSATLSVFWLQDRLTDFLLSDDSRSVASVATDDFAELNASNPDIVILYGSGKFANWKTEKLFDEVLAPVASPAVVEHYRKIVRYGIDDPKLAPSLLDYPRWKPSWVDWRGWLKGTKHEHLNRLSRHKFKTYSKTIGAATKGEGIALGSLAMITDRISSGELQRLDDTEFYTGFGYYLGYPADRGLSDNGRVVYDFLLEVSEKVRDFISAMEPQSGPDADQTAEVIELDTTRADAS